ncbi:MAG: hypothetical protein A49_09100 [Methyloceanibacter sp.]|nr:MAG: hypothetical protein A49_09100 [Methyloceanibacter sp.]
MARPAIVLAQSGHSSRRIGVGGSVTWPHEFPYSVNTSAASFMKSSGVRYDTYGFGFVNLLAIDLLTLLLHTLRVPSQPPQLVSVEATYCA